MNRNNLITQIEEAFKNVSLNDGVGIYEAEAIDNYASEDIRKTERKKDVRNDWTYIIDDVIDQYYSVLSFMDDDGLRFVIPAYMRFAVRFYDTNASASIDAIIHVLADSRQWDFLTNKQKQVVADFLSFMVLEAGNHVDSWQASLAYENIWSQYQQTKT